MKQKDIFLESEGDEWFERNRDHCEQKKMAQDPVIQSILKILDGAATSGGDLLEIGCGEAKRLDWIKGNLNIGAFGIEPSRKAVQVAQDMGLRVIRGTAEKLPFESKSFDFVVFGFCLYLCDREDLFQIGCEADRVLKNKGWVVIQDFYSKNIRINDYHHKLGVFWRSSVSSGN